MQPLASSDSGAEKLHPSHENIAAVPMRIKTANSPHDRHSQSKSMILSDNLKAIEPISRHRRNHSQHNLTLPEFISPLEQTVIKEGCLLKAKIADGGKKLRKNWATSWLVLTGRKIEFYKESKQPAVANLKPGYKPEWMDLCGAHIEWTTEKSSKKNVFQITTISGNEVLLQSDIDIVILEWFHAIKNAIERLPKDKSNMSRNKIARSSSSELLNSFETDSKEPKAENRRSLIFRLNYSISDTTDRNRVKSRLKKFITRRPSLRTLQEKGIIKDQIFGSHLHKVCEREGSTVPQFVKMCINVVEKRGLDVDGIYRVSGNLATIQKLRFFVNQEEKLNLDDSQWEDIHVVTGALKMFFRELPEPLFPYCFFEQFVEAIKIQDNNNKVKCIKDLVQKLPRPNYDTMKILFEHLQKIAAKENLNLMTPQSLGIVFGPTLLRPEKETGSMAVYMVYQNQLVELMLSKCSTIFSSEKD
uniref:Rho GTPase-activating protein 15 n=1 Tax=Anolis carolinensis TaxID=28377 RepID=G1KBK0_ANOCA|nr:PREDICTED: rho GTPase-activating protein 15 [Anolis carolinensis]XP_008111100.1 PREDICTED: rho GTPase-activating protein 15 [Anolis carolinensis]XP_008111108.1 PREDICTED: rho GTPase-activating protein 15 [Anolis carolinensis]|eukprot:XP_008111093.1 PREDICTED: rho GTPase-activating protein 15 [Anolis carolinensis]